MASYRLFYWPQIPGRGEFVRLAFAAAKVPLPEVNDVGKLVALTSADGGVAGHEPQFAVPVLEVQPERQAPFYLSQTGNILQFIAKRFGLDGEQPGVEADVTHAQVLQFTLTGLDWALEAHNVHHPMYVARLTQFCRALLRRPEARGAAVHASLCARAHPQVCQGTCPC